jgi:hypothetical protein
MVSLVEISLSMLTHTLQLGVIVLSLVHLFNAQGDQGFAQFKDIDVRHNGIELKVLTVLPIS